MARYNGNNSHPPTKIKALNIVISSICLLLFLVTMYAFFGLYYKPTAASQMDNQGGMSGLANLYYFVFHLVFNSAIAVICLILLGIVAHRKNEKSLFTKINFIILATSLLFPFIAFGLFFFAS